MALLYRASGPVYVHGAIPRWTLLSAFLAPASLVACWLVAGLVQRDGYNAAEQTMSVLAGDTASNPRIMTIGLYSVGTFQIVTAFGLSIGRPKARILLAIGGLTGLGVASFPQAQHGSATAIHLMFATLSVSLLAVWPATIGSRAWSRPLVLSFRGSLVATFVFVGLLAWLFAAAHGGGALGVAERVDTAIENSWPLVVVLAVRRASRSQRGQIAGFLDPAPDRHAHQQQETEYEEDHQ
jgi:hypothetical membrane protein